MYLFFSTYFSLFCILSTFLFSSLQAQEALSLKQALEISLSKVYSIEIARKQAELAKNNNTHGEAGRYPSLSFNTNSQNAYSNINNPTSFLNGAELINIGLTPSLDAAWVLYDGSKVRINKERLSLLAEQQEQSLEQFIQRQSQELMRAYYTALVQKRRLDIQGELLQLSREKLSYIEARRAYGQALEFDRLQVQDAYLNDSIQWVLQKNNYELALTQLGLAMGLDPQMGDFPYSLSLELDYELAEYSYEDIAQGLKQNNQELRVQRFNESLAQVDMDLQLSMRMPRLSLNAGISEQVTLARINGRMPQIPEEWRGGSTFGLNLGLNLSYTIYDGGRIRRGIENSSLRAQVTRLQSQDMERRLLSNLLLQYQRYQNQKQLLELSQQLLANAKRNVEISAERFEAGALNFFDYRTIQINYARSLNTLQDAYLNAKSTEIEMLLSTGTILESLAE